MFKTTNKVRIHDTDMVGILYFPKIFRFAHEAFEDFFISLGFNIHDFFSDPKMLFVMVHCEADYLSPFHLGDVIHVDLILKHIGTTSFTLHFELYKFDGTHMGSVKTVYVCVEKKQFKKQKIPDKLRNILEKHLVNEKAQ